MTIPYCNKVVRLGSSVNGRRRDNVLSNLWLISLHPFLKRVGRDTPQLATANRPHLGAKDDSGGSVSRGSEHPEEESPN